MTTGPATSGTTVLRLAQANRFAEIIDMFAPSLRPLLTPESLRAAWNAEIERYGPVTAVGGPVTDPAGPAGTLVRLERDVEARDRYDRLLAYVYRDQDGLFVDLAMVTDGFAGTLTISPNVAHREELDRAAADAKAAQRGLWHTCGGNHVVSGG